MKTKKMICFDMDGTIADLYGVPNWLERLRVEDVTPYLEAKPMWDMQALRKILLHLMDAGWEIRVITWLSMNSSEEYKRNVRIAKRQWLENHNFPAEKCHMVQYGATKADSVRAEAGKAVLIDDNTKVRNGWTLGQTIDPTTCSLITELEKLLEG